MPKKTKAKVVASKVRHIPNKPSARPEEVKPQFKIKIPFWILFIICLLTFSIIFSFLNKGKSNDLPDYMTTSQSYQQKLVEEVPQPQQSGQYSDNRTSTSFINSIIYGFIEKDWFKSLFMVFLFISTLSFFNAIGRRWRW